AKALSETAISLLMDALERGESDALKTYLRAMSRFHKYSWGNVLLICKQKPDATHVAGFHSWLRMSRQVPQGLEGNRDSCADGWTEESRRHADRRRADAVVWIPCRPRV